MKKIRFALTVIKIFMKNQIQDIKYLMVDIINMITRCFILFLLYSYAFEINGGIIDGIDCKTALYSMFVYFCMMTLNIRKVYKLIMIDVKSGNIEMFINKPMSYIAFTFCKSIGIGIYSFLVISIIGTIAMLLFIGIPDLNLSIFIPTFIIAFILGRLLEFIMYSIVGVLSFFIQDVRPIYWILDKFVMILGGSYLPIALFPQFMKVLAYISPFGAIHFTSSSVYSSWNYEFTSRILLQVMWIIIFGVLLKHIFNKAKEKTMINGG